MKNKKPKRISIFKKLKEKIDDYFNPNNKITNLGKVYFLSFYVGGRTIIYTVIISIIKTFVYIIQALLKSFLVLNAEENPALASLSTFDVDCILEGALTVNITVFIVCIVTIIIVTIIEAVANANSESIIQKEYDDE